MGKFRTDGYSNMLNKYGTRQDNSAAYEFAAEPFADDITLTSLYAGNGLFAKIIDRPSEEAMKHGFDIDYGDAGIAEYVDSEMDRLEFEDKFSTAEKWARLYGGGLIVMLVDDGRGLEEPMDMENARRIEELVVFDRTVVEPDYSGIYQGIRCPGTDLNRKLWEPEYYQISSIYGCFTVHRSRCLIFRNGKLPEQTFSMEYRYWGIPEYVKMKRALRECILSHEDGVKLLERSAQAIYKMKNLANMLSTVEGEDKVLNRLQLIDMARNLINTIAIDNDGEDYDFKTLTLSGVKDVIDATCNMLSAVTDIPQTILFGRSPAGENSTGEGDMENYYNMVENIQKKNMKANARTVIELILRQGMADGTIKKMPEYKVKFAALWSMSDSEKASVEQTKSQTEYTKAQTAQIYMDAQVLDPSEVRKSLAADGSMEIEEILDNPNDELDITDDIFVPEPGETISISGLEEDGEQTETGREVISICGTEKDADQNGRVIRIAESGSRETADSHDYPAAAVLIIHEGRILCADRNDGKGICGPGGHVEEGETEEDAAVREAYEEFHITPLNLIPLGEYEGSTGLYLPSKVYFTEQFTGNPEADGKEMQELRWMALGELRREALFPPFEASLDMLEKFISKYLTISISKDTIQLKEYDGGPGSGRYPKGSGKNPKSATKVSARGENIECTGFANKKLLEAHVKRHGKEFPGMNEVQYVEHAKNFLKQKCSDTIDGYKTKDGEICRFDKTTGEYAKGIPGNQIRTCFIAKYNKKTGKSDLKAANKYFKNLKEAEGIEDD